MTAPLVTIRLSGAPEGKGRPRFSRRTGRAYTPEATRNFEASLRMAGQDAMAGRPPIGGALDILVTAWMPLPTSKPKKWKVDALAGLIRPTTKPDADNIVKSIDALNGVVFDDDKQGVDVAVRKFYSDRPELVIEVRPATQGLPSREP